MSIQPINPGLLLGQPQLFQEIFTQRPAVSAHFAYRRQVQIASPLGVLVHGELLRGRAVDVVA